MEKSKWLVLAEYSSGMSIMKYVTSKEIVKFIKDNKMVFSMSVDVINSYVYPYSLRTFDNQDAKIASIEIRCL
jgi:hypothetical protein